MNQITHWNPFKAIARTAPSAEFDDLFRSFGMRPLLGQLQVPDIRLDVNENEQSYAIKADIPGVKKEDIDVIVDGRQVSITATFSESTEKKAKNAIYSERSEGQAHRSFMLPSEVDAKGAQARYENGVLELTLPKRSNGNDHRIKVS